MNNAYMERELSFSELLGASWKIYIKNMGYIFLVTVMVFLPVFIINLFIPISYKTAVLNFISYMAQYYEGGVPITDLQSYAASPAFTNVINYISITTMIEFCFFPLATGAITYISAQSLAGASVRVSGLLDASIVKALKFIVTTALAGLFMVISSAFFIIAIYLGIVMIYYQNIISYYNRWGMTPFFISSRLVRGRWFRTLGFVLALGLTYFVAGQLLDTLYIFSGISGLIIADFVYFIVNKAVMSFLTVVFAVRFINLCQVRKPEVINKRIL